ncbi:MAG: ketoacyl-ACP synthase III [Eubacteriaceae bacterium]|nr:ketoacyl-ACP synthase III [Eubacteriaceae bacterium]
MKGLTILSTGSALPRRQVTNDELSKTLDTSDAWIRERTGIRSRYLCSGDENGEWLATLAGKRALAKSGIPKEKIGACIVATVGPDTMSPSTANKVAFNLGLSPDIPSFDISAACSGFMYALRIAQGLIAEGDRPYALIIGCEVLSRQLDFTDRSTCVLFGDGAGAVIAAARKDALFVTTLGSWADDTAIHVPGPAASSPYASMDGRKVFRFAVKIVPKVIDRLLTQSGLSLDAIDQVVCHQANARIIDHVVKKMGVDPQKFFKNVDHTGNTSAASIPLALDEMAQKGLLHPRTTLLCVGFGAGLTWGGAILRTE